MLLSNQSKLFRADPYYIKEMEINRESFVTVRDKKFNFKTRAFFMKFLFGLF